MLIYVHCRGAMTAAGPAPEAATAHYLGSDALLAWCFAPPCGFNAVEERDDAGKLLRVYDRDGWRIAQAGDGIPASTMARLLAANRTARGRPTLSMLRAIRADRRAAG